MATKTATLYARIEPETKVCAESILESLGIPVLKGRFHSSVEVAAGEVFSTEERPWGQQGHVLDHLKQTSAVQAG